MNRIALVGAALASLAMLVASLSDADAQRRYYGGRAKFPMFGQSTQDLVRRLEHLEQRVRILESVVELPTPDARTPAMGMSVEQAELQLANAEERLQTLQSLYRRGSASKAELEANRFELERARLLVKLSVATRDERPTEQITAAIAINRAEQNLAIAKRGLDLMRRLAAKGFVLPANIDSHERAVEVAQRRLEQAKAAAEESREEPAER